jgi:hypothetical protein
MKMFLSLIITNYYSVLYTDPTCTNKHCEKSISSIFLIKVKLNVAESNLFQMRAIKTVGLIIWSSKRVLSALNILKALQIINLLPYWVHQRNKLYLL